MKNYIEVAYNEKEKPFGPYPLELAAYLVKRYGLIPGMKLLDNGCGRGEYLHAFAELGLNTFGADLSSFCPAAKVVDFNNQQLPFPDDFFDVVFSKSVLEHIANTEYYISEMKRVLRKDGRLILLVPDWKSTYKIFYDDPTHIHPYTEKSLDRLLNMCGFAQLPKLWENANFLYKCVSLCLRSLGPVKKIYKNKFIRFSRELMILASGRKD